MQCCTCSKWVHLRCSQLSLSKFRSLDSSHSWSCPPCCAPTRNTVTPSSESSDMYTSTVQWPPSANAALSPHPRFQTSYPLLPILYFLSLPPHHRPLLLAVLLHLLPPLPLTLSGFFNGMLEIFDPEALNYFTFSRPILSTLSAFRNPILIPLPLSGFLDSLHCILIAPTPGLAFSLVMPHRLAAALSFSSGRAYLSLNSLTFSLSLLDPCSGYVGVNISLNNSSSLSFLNVYAPPPILSSPKNVRTDTFSPSILPSSRNLFILGDFNCHHPLWNSRGTSDRRGKEVFHWVISSNLLPLNDPATPTLLHRSSPDISFSPSSLPLSCSWEVLQNLGSDHSPIPLSVPLSPVFRPNERPPSFNFQKARWDGFASYFDFHCPSAEEYSSLSLFSVAAVFYFSGIECSQIFHSFRPHQTPS